MSAGIWGTWGGAMRCRYKKGQHQGDALGYFTTERSGERKWVVVLWDDDNMPKIHPFNMMMFKAPSARHWKGEK